MLIHTADSSHAPASTELMLSRLGHLAWLSIGLTAIACGLVLMNGVLAQGRASEIPGEAAATRGVLSLDRAAMRAPADGGFLDHSVVALLPEVFDSEPGASVAAYEHLPADATR
jgi:hypothetical protein